MSVTALPPPKTWSRRQVAARVGLCLNTFRAKLPDLYARGFPHPLPGLNRWSITAVEVWLDSNGGPVNHAPTQADRDLDGWEP